MCNQEVSRFTHAKRHCSRAKKWRRTVQKTVLHVQFLFALIRSNDFVAVFIAVALETLRFSRHKIDYLPWDQSLSVYYYCFTFNRAIQVCQLVTQVQCSKILYIVTLLVLLER